MDRGVKLGVDFDTERFIKEIQKRQSIWNKNSEQYSNRLLRYQQWQEITEMYADESDSPSERDAVGIILRKKWKNIKDCFLKDLKGKIPRNGKNSRNIRYVFFNDLLFLKDTINWPENDKIKETTKADCSDSSEDDKKPMAKKRRKVKRVPKVQNKSERNQYNTTTTSYQQPSTTSLPTDYHTSNPDPETDGDLLFLMSLVQDIKRVPEERRLHTKLEILQIIKNAQEDQPYPMTVPVYVQGHNCEEDTNIKQEVENAEDAISIHNSEFKAG